MNLRTVFSIIMTILAFVVPIGVLLKEFGPNTPISPDSVTHLMAVSGAGIFACIVTLIGALTLPKEGESISDKIVKILKEAT